MPVASTPEPRGRMVDLGGRRLHGVFAGPRDAVSPLIVLESGSFGFSADWAAVQRQLGEVGYRSLAYDRAGLGFSDPGPEPRDSRAIVSDLEAFLLATHETGPLILCGHSMAGLHVRLFAVRQPARVKGLVLVDATTPEAMDAKMVSGFVEQFSRLSRMAAWGAEAGLLGVFAGTAMGDAIGLDGAPGSEKRWAFALASHNLWSSKEVDVWAESARQARDAGVLDPDLPVAVVLAGGGARRGLRDMQTAPAMASRHGLVERVTGASHATILNEDHAHAVVKAIEHVASFS